MILTLLRVYCDRLLRGVSTVNLRKYQSIIRRVRYVHFLFLLSVEQNSQNADDPNGMGCRVMARTKWNSSFALSYMHLMNSVFCSRSTVETYRTYLGSTIELDFANCSRLDGSRKVM